MVPFWILFESKAIQIFHWIGFEYGGKKEGKEDTKFSAWSSESMELSLTEIAKALGRGGLGRNSIFKSEILSLRCLLNVQVGRLNR